MRRTMSTIEHQSHLLSRRLLPVTKIADANGVGFWLKIRSARECFRGAALWLGACAGNRFLGACVALIEPVDVSVVPTLSNPVLCNPLCPLTVRDFSRFRCVAAAHQTALRHVTPTHPDSHRIASLRFRVRHITSHGTSSHLKFLHCMCHHVLCCLSTLPDRISLQCRHIALLHQSKSSADKYQKHTAAVPVCCQDPAS